MKKKVIFALPVLALAGALLLIPNITSYAQEDVSELKKQIQELKEEVALLKQSTPQPQVGSAQPAHIWSYQNQSAWDPFTELQQMQDRMNRLFRDSFRRSAAGGPAMGLFYEPDLDIQDKEDHYLFKIDLPGMDKNKIDIQVTDHDLVISGERSYQSEQQDDREGFYRMERRFGSFSRRLPLPEDASSDGVDAKYEKGVLEIKVPKEKTKEAKEPVKKVKVT